MVLTSEWHDHATYKQCLDMTLVSSTQEQANTDVQAMQTLIRNAVQMQGAHQLQFSVNLHGLERSPSIRHIRSLASFMREMRPLLQQRLRKTTICVNSKVQRALLTLVFRLQQPATPIEVKYSTQKT